MATTQGNRRRPGRKDAEPAEPQGPTPCGPCRGTGRLISGAGGTPHEVACPWCDGTGTAIPGRDAQDHPAEQPPAA